MQQAQTLEQRRRNAKFAKVQEAKMGKSEEQVKKRTKEAPKAPISMFWIGECSSPSLLWPWPWGHSPHAGVYMRAAPLCRPSNPEW